MAFKFNKNKAKKAPSIQPQSLDIDFEETASGQTIPDEVQEQTPAEPSKPKKPGFKTEDTFERSDGLSFEFADPSHLAQEHKESEEKNHKNKFRKPSVTPQVDNDISIDMSNTQGEIHGSDFDKDGNIKKRKKKFSISNLYGGIAIVGLLAIIGVGALYFTNSSNETQEPEDLTNVPVTPDNSKKPDEEITYEDDVPTTPDESTDSKEGEGTDETVLVDGKETKPLEGYLVYNNEYTNFTLQYPERWYISENTQEGFNQIKENTKDDQPFSFTKAVLESKVPLVSLKSPQADNQEQIIIVAEPKGFDTTKVSAPLSFVTSNLTDLLKKAQPTLKEALTINGKTFDVTYDIYKEYEDYTLTIQASTKIGENVLMVYFLVPYHAVGEMVADEEDEKPTTDAKDKTTTGTTTTDVKTPANTATDKPVEKPADKPTDKPVDKATASTGEKDKKESETLIDLETIKSEYLEVFMNVLTSLNFE